jgi:hypothetical protein
MNKIKYGFFVLVLLWAFRASSSAQTSHDLVIQDFTVTGHYLNDDIMSDSTATGTRKDPDRVYVLKRNGVYLTNAFIRNDNWTLRIRSEYAGGPKPTIYNSKNATTSTYASSIVQVRGNLSLKNIALVGWSEFYPNEISLMPAFILDVEGAGFSVDVDSCILEGSRQSLIQVNVASHRVKVTNTVFAQAGSIQATNIGNGRPIDCRTISVDSLFLQNCSFMDATDRVVRHYASTGPIDVFTFDHNTVVNTLSMHGNIALGFVGRKQTITNNIFVDNFTLGNDSTDTVRLTEFGDSGEKGPSGQFRMCFVSCVPNDTTQWVVKNNFWSVTTGVQAWYDTHAAAALGNLIPLTWHINKKIGSDSLTAFTKEAIVFTKSTPNLTPFATWYWKSPPDGPGRQKANTGFSAGVDMYRPQWTYYVDSLKLSYPTTAKAYTGGQAGFPAGDLNWFPTRKAAWLTTGVEKTTGVVPATFDLSQNYPNPFNPSTTLQYSISKSGHVVLEVYNLLGQSVARLVDEVLTPGSYKTTFDASALSSGVYLYRLKAGDFVQTRKMVLMK